MGSPEWGCFWANYESGARFFEKNEEKGAEGFEDDKKHERLVQLRGPEEGGGAMGSPEWGHFWPNYSRGARFFEKNEEKGTEGFEDDKKHERRVQFRGPGAKRGPMTSPKWGPF